jgi:hypothetical protein
MDKHIIKIEDFKNFKSVEIIASDTRAIKQIIQKTYLREVSKGRFELENVLEVTHLGKTVCSTAHLMLAIIAYNKA